jgi:hypothetical protein
VGIERAFFKRAITCTVVAFLLMPAIGCDSGTSNTEIAAASTGNGEHGEAQRQARLKAFGTTGIPKSERTKTAKAK